MFLFFTGCDTPRISFRELRHDFGETDQQQTLNHTFLFVNTGGAPLLIHKVHAG